MSAQPQLLVVDDAQGRLGDACEQLVKDGYHLTRCAGSRQALPVLREQRFDLLLACFEMPGLDGAGLASQAMALQHDLVAVLVTSPDTTDAALDLMAGLVDTIRAPFRMSDMRAVVTRALDKGRLQVENRQLSRTAADNQVRLDAVTDELNALAGRIAHDLQAVMQVIDGFACALQRGATAKLDAKEVHYLQRIVETSARGSRLVNDLLAYARLGTDPLEFRPVSLARAVAQAQAAAGLHAPDRAIEWTVGELPDVAGDPAMVEQALVHLLSNAVKYTRGQEPARIRIEAAASDIGHEIRIHDNGVGFDPEGAERLFQPFERLHGSAQFEGNGMGLANVKRIALRHGGAVRAQSWPGEGAMFAFTLPSLAAHPGAASYAAAAVAATPARRVLRILVVDDDPTVLLSLRNMLELDGHAVSTAAGGQIGVEAFEHALREGEAFDVVVTDFGMPHMDGRAVARAVKAASATTLVFMLTGWGSHVDQMDDWQQHVDNILAKPLRLAHVREALAAAGGMPAPP
ncbi:MAG: response regulator [Comamonadaceae bacterium]|nr:MAG: response regulator [Comamonadaceae bacterium]